MSQVYLETERLRFREINFCEAIELFDLDSDPGVMKYLSGEKPSDMETCQKTIDRVLDYYKKYDLKFDVWFAEEKATGYQNPELGYRFKKKF